MINLKTKQDTQLITSHGDGRGDKPRERPFAPVTPAEAKRAVTLRSFSPRHSAVCTGCAAAATLAAGKAVGVAQEVTTSTDDSLKKPLETVRVPAAARRGTGLAAGAGVVISFVALAVHGCVHDVRAVVLQGGLGRRLGCFSLLAGFLTLKG